MGLLRALPFLTTALLAFAACQSSEALPPPLGNCLADSGCSPATGVSGSGGGTPTDAGADVGASACTADPAASQCDQCAAAKCCPSLSACTSSSTCGQLFLCILNCPTTDCVATCKQQFPSGTQPYQALESCMQIDCPICVESGVGDPCSATSCVPGLACQGSWCTAPCVKDSDCRGIGANGDNILGQANVCIPTSAGARCAPGCGVNADCSYFPGTYCHSTLSIENTYVQVCAALPDASSD